MHMPMPMHTCTHLLVGCFFYYVADSSRDSYDETWVDSYGDAASVAAGDKMRLYLHSMYWALTTLTTVGALQPCDPVG